jgi:hypothetical protein
MESRREGEEKEGWGDGGGVVVEVGKCGGERCTGYRPDTMGEKGDGEGRASVGARSR